MDSFWLNSNVVKYSGHVYFEVVGSHILDYKALTYLKSHNKFHEYISITKGLSSKDMLNFSDTSENQHETESVTENSVSDGKEMSKNNDKNASEVEYVSAEDPLNMHRNATNETTLISEIANIINEKNVIIDPGQGKHQFLFWVINFVKNKHFLIFFLNVNLAIMFLEIFK